MSIPPLPPGWDSDRVYSTSEIELAVLPQADQDLIATWRAADGAQSTANLRALVASYTNKVNEGRVAAGLPTLEEADRAIAEEMGLENYDPTTQRDLFDVAKSMHNMGAEAWGFVVFKTWGYKFTEKERWDAYWKKWNELMDQELRDMGAVGDLREGFAGTLQWWLVDHESMDGKSFVEVRECFAELVEEDEKHIPFGLDVDLGLMIDKDAVDSLLDGDPNQAFVWGVDVNFDAEDEQDEVVDPCPGHFKVAISVLIPELWHTLDVENPGNLYPGRDKIYRGIVGGIEEGMSI